MALDDQVPAERTGTREDLAESTLANRPSMADVGRLANVSSQTVSRYFTGVGYVREDTRERIAAAIEQLGYRRNQSARNFRRQRTDTIGVLSMGPLNYGSAEILSGLSQAARREEMTLAITQLDIGGDAVENNAEVARVLDHLLSVPVDGIVVLTPFSGVESVLSKLAGSIPMITVADRMIGIEAVASAHSRVAADEATEHLLGLGHREILHVAGPAGRNEATERVEGYRDAMIRAGQEPLILDAAKDWTSSSGFRAAKLAEKLAFTAVFAANDEIALGFMHGMEARELRAPRDYSIVGIDDMPSAAYFSPALTTARLDFRGLGTVALQELLRQVRTGEPARHCGIQPRLVVRDSSSVPPASGPRRRQRASATNRPRTGVR